MHPWRRLSPRRSQQRTPGRLRISECRSSPVAAMSRATCSAFFETRGWDQSVVEQATFYATSSPRRWAYIVDSENLSPLRSALERTRSLPATQEQSAKKRNDDGASQCCNAAHSGGRDHTLRRYKSVAVICWTS